MPEHRYHVDVTWTGNRGRGTESVRAYDRDHEIRIDGKPVVAASSDPAFRGDPSRHNPEELLVASLSSCHMLWYLNLCAVAGVVVTGYEDRAHGVMVEEADGGGRFREVVLEPRVTVASAGMREAAEAQHERAHALCFIARSVNFPVRHEPSLDVRS
jgi:organic hydroperoxide reductase OsmC/OhrA